MPSQGNNITTELGMGKGFFAKQIREMVLFGCLKVCARERERVCVCVCVCVNAILACSLEAKES